MASRKLYSLPSNIKEHDWTLNLPSHAFPVVELVKLCVNKCVKLWFELSVCRSVIDILNILDSIKAALPVQGIAFKHSIRTEKSKIMLRLRYRKLLNYSNEMHILFVYG